MSDKTKIEWCDHTASPWHGCQHATHPDGSPQQGCINCYAEAMSVRNPGTLGIWGPAGTRVKSKSFIGNLYKWDRQAEQLGKPATVFPSICDPFEDRPELQPWRSEMFETIDQCIHLRLLLLTKRPENIRRMWPKWDNGEINTNYRHNCWLLTSIATQADADRNVPELLKCRDLVPVLGMSAEPLVNVVNLEQVWVEDKSLSPGDREYPAFNIWNALTGFRGHVGGGWESGISLDWVIVGGESGAHARPCNIEWIRAIRDQCAHAGVPCFIKQLGAKPHCTIGENHRHPDWISWLNLKDKKGGDWSEWPEDLRVRQWPQAKEVMQNST